MEKRKREEEREVRQTKMEERKREEEREVRRTNQKQNTSAGRYPKHRRHMNPKT